MKWTAYLSRGTADYYLVREQLVKILKEHDIELTYDNRWDNVEIIWKPLSHDVSKDLPSLKFMAKLFTSDNTLTLKKYLVKTGLKYPNIFDILPYTMIYNDSIQFSYPENCMWIVKPDSSYSGKGIRLYRNIDEVIKSKNLTGTVIQRYIHNPLLIDGKKFDIRAHVLVTNTGIYYHKYGFLSIAPKKYDLTILDFGCHITNTDLHDTEPESYGLLYKARLTANDVYDFIKKIKFLFEDVQNKELQCDRKFKTFELFGLDIMFDSDYHPWLIEINKNPGGLTPELFRDTVNLAMFDKLSDDYIKI